MYRNSSYFYTIQTHSLFILVDKDYHSQLLNPVNCKTGIQVLDYYRTKYRQDVKKQTISEYLVNLLSCKLHTKKPFSPHCSENGFL